MCCSIYLTLWRSLCVGLLHRFVADVVNKPPAVHQHFSCQHRFWSHSIPTAESKSQLYKAVLIEIHLLCQKQVYLNYPFCHNLFFCSHGRHADECQGWVRCGGLCILFSPSKSWWVNIILQVCSYHWYLLTLIVVWLNACSVHIMVTSCMICSELFSWPVELTVLKWCSYH